jgi:hypothetical protein
MQGVDFEADRVASISHAMQKYLIYAQELGAPLPQSIYRELPKQESDAFRTAIMVASLKFKLAISTVEKVRLTERLVEDTEAGQTPVSTSGVCVRLTPLADLYGSIANKLGIPMEKVGSAHHIRDHASSYWENSAMPGMLLCRPKSSCTLLETIRSDWQLRSSRVNPDFALHVAFARVEGVDLRHSVSRFAGSVKALGKPIGTGYLGRLILEVAPVTVAMIEKNFCLQICSPQAFRMHDARKEEAGSRVLKSLEEMVNKLIATLPVKSDLGEGLHDFDLDEYGSLEPCEVSAPPLPERKHISPYLFDGYDLASCRLTVGDAFVHAVRDFSTPQALRETFMTMLYHSGPGASLHEALSRNAQLTRTYLQTGIDVPEAKRLRRVGLLLEASSRDKFRE